MKVHRIPDLSNLALFTLLLMDSHLPSILVGSTLILTAYLLTLLCSAGGGDFKLLIALSITQGDLIATDKYLLYFACALLLAFVFHLLRRGTLKESIAFAPVLLAPFLASYLDI